jgi:CDP-paratose synthetase
MKSVLISGITCYIGCELARRLVADGVQVSGIVREGSKLERLSPFRDQVTLYQSDGSQNALDLAVSESAPDVLVHLAGYYVWEHTPEQAAELVESNIAFGVRLLEAVKKSGVSKFINTGSHFQYFESDVPNPINLYAETKQAFADILSYYGKQHGLDYLNLIIYESYGPRDWRKKLMQAIVGAQRSGQTLSMVATDPIMDFAYIDDIVDAYIHAASLLETSANEVSGKSYALSGGERLTISELVKLFEEVGGQSIITESREDPSDARRILNPWTGPALPDWQAKVSMRDGIRKFLENYR